MDMLTQDLNSENKNNETNQIWTRTQYQYDTRRIVSALPYTTHEKSRPVSCLVQAIGVPLL
eukprot:2045838-Karenia_brevis.AAC.1